MVVDEVNSDHTLSDDEKKVALRLATDLPEPGQAPWMRIGLETLRRAHRTPPGPSSDRGEELAFLTACTYRFLLTTNRDEWRGPWPQAGTTPTYACA